jgi:integrase
LGVERTKNLTAEAIRSAQKESWSAATTNSHRRHIGVFCRWLIGKGWLERDPTKEIPVRPTRDTAPKHITRAERRALIRYVQARGQRTGNDGRYSSYAFLARFLQINPLMGLRPTPALNLKWADVNLQDRIAHVRSAKGGTSRTVPVAERAQRALQSMPKESPFVYGGAGYWKATRALRTIRDELGMGEHVTLYATRHSYGTWLAEAGVPVHQIKRLMGHSSIQVTQRYMHASPEQGQRYVDAAFA